MEERWTKSRIDPEDEATPAAVAGFKPLIVAELRALELADLCAVFVAGRDAEEGDLALMPAAAKVRGTLWKMYDAWWIFAQRRSLDWSVPDWSGLKDVVPVAEHSRKARTVDLTVWIPCEIERARRLASLSARHAEHLFEASEKKPIRSVANSVAAIFGKELDYLERCV